MQPQHCRIIRQLRAGPPRFSAIVTAQDVRAALRGSSRLAPFHSWHEGNSRHEAAVVVPDQPAPFDGALAIRIVEDNRVRLGVRCGRMRRSERGGSERTSDADVTKGIRRKKIPGLAGRVKV